MMRRLRFAGAMFAALVLASTPALAVERILLFVSGVKVARNGDLTVAETIRVQAEGREIRRGILRDFPTTYTRRDRTLDVENTWAQRFAGVLAAAAAAGGTTGAWYSGNQSWAQDPTGLAHDLSHSLSQTIASASTPPGSGGGGSSGSGGGGSSGGGGGSGW